MNNEKTHTQLLLGGLEERLEVSPNQQERQNHQGEMEGLEVDLKNQLDERRKKRNQSAREYRKRHPERWLEIRRRSRENNLEKARLADRKYYAEHREVRISQISESIKRCHVRVRKNKRDYRTNNVEKVRAYFRNYLPAYKKNLRKTNPQFLLADRMRSTLKRGLKNQGMKKTQRTEAMIGCTLPELRKHIESQFVNGMAWDKPETFAIDHIVPVVAFDLLDAEECKLAFHWRNLRPLDPVENKMKSDKLPDPLPDWLPEHVREQLTRRMNSK